jgi:hypothetical protein
MRILLVAAIVSALLPAAIDAQIRPDAGIMSTIDHLFDAMRKSDTTAVRATFLAGGRVIVMPAPDANAEKLTALSLDDFVKFTGNNAPGSWIERAWNPSTSTSGTLGNVWFDYDIYRGGALAQCGSNSVQLQSVAGEWKIVSMAFSAQKTGCPSHEPKTLL